MNPTQSQPEERPEPPEGYRIITHGELISMSKTPEDLIVLDPTSDGDEWDASYNAGKGVDKLHADLIYATRTPIPSGETGGRVEHNPDGLTPEQYGAPEFELLTHAEMKRRDMQSDADLECWSTDRKIWLSGFQGTAPGLTYRRRVTPPTATVAPGDGKEELGSIDKFYEDAVEDIAHALAHELEVAELSRNDLVTVNREKLRGIAQRILAKAPASPSDKDAEKPTCNCAGGEDGAWGLMSHTSNCAVTLQAKLESAEAERDVLNGTWCAQNVSEGRGKCGVCKNCLNAELTAARTQVKELREALGKVKWILDAQRVADLRDLHEHYKMMAGRVMDEVVTPALAHTAKEGEQP